MIRLLALAGPDTRLIPGHGQFGTRAERAEYRAMLAPTRQRLAVLKAQGLTGPSRR